MDALSARRFVCELISSIVPVSVLTFSNSCWNSCNILSTSPDNLAMVLVLSTTSESSFVLISVCSTDSLTSFTTSLISEATFSTWSLILVVMSVDESVLSRSIALFCDSSFILDTTKLAPCLFSSSSSRTTVIPSTIILLESLTCSTVLTTLSRSSLIESVSAPSERFR